LNHAPHRRQHGIFTKEDARQSKRRQVSGHDEHRAPTVGFRPSVPAREDCRLPSQTQVTGGNRPFFKGLNRVPNSLRCRHVPCIHFRANISLFDPEEKTMASIVIKDLLESVELDREAMVAIVGGARSSGSARAPLGRTIFQTNRIVRYPAGFASRARRETGKPE
jgi:hypothetical protein